MKSYWREKCAPIIADVIAGNKGKSVDEVRGALFEAYPFGERKYHPYKIWCDEVREQLGLKRKKASPTRQELLSAGQMEMKI